MKRPSSPLWWILVLLLPPLADLVSALTPLLVELRQWVPLLIA